MATGQTSSIWLAEMATGQPWAYKSCISLRTPNAQIENYMRYIVVMIEEDKITGYEKDKI
jgi:hypothetical protein